MKGGEVWQEPGAPQMAFVEIHVGSVEDDWDAAVLTVASRGRQTKLLGAAAAEVRVSLMDEGTHPVTCTEISSAVNVS